MSLSATVDKLQATVAKQRDELLAEKAKAKEVIMALKKEVEELLEGASEAQYRVNASNSVFHVYLPTFAEGEVAANEAREAFTKELEAKNAVLQQQAENVSWLEARRSNTIFVHYFFHNY